MVFKVNIKQFFLSITVLVLCLFIVNITSVSAKQYRLKIQSAYPRGDVSMELLKAFADSAKKKSNGDLQIMVFADGDIVPGDQLFNAAKRGTVDMFHALGAMWAGIVPVGDIEFGLPYQYSFSGNKSVTESADLVRDFFYKTGFVDILREEYAKNGLYWLDLHSYGKHFVVSNKPMQTCQDVQGKKIRSEGVFSKYFNQLGARGTEISGMETYMGLKLGTLDAAQWDVSAVTGLKWHEVAPYRIIGGMNDAHMGHIILNLKTWNSLPGNLKEALSGAAEDYYHEINKVYTEEMNKVDALVKEGKIKESYLDEECLVQYEKAAVEIWDEVVGRGDPAVEKAMSLVKDWRKTLE